MSTVVKVRAGVRGCIGFELGGVMRGKEGVVERRIGVGRSRKILIVVDCILYFLLSLLFSFSFVFILLFVFIYPFPQ